MWIKWYLTEKWFGNCWVKQQNWTGQLIKNWMFKKPIYPLSLYQADKAK